MVRRAALAAGISCALASTAAEATPTPTQGAEGEHTNALEAPATAAAATPIAPAPPASASRPLPNEPALHHVPLSVAAEHTELTVAATIDRPDLVKRALLIYRHGGQVDEVSFERSALQDKPYVAVVPGEHVDRPGIAYAIEIERTDGRRMAVFASRDEMQPVEVVGDVIDAQEEALLARLSGRRFVVEANGEYVRFGAGTGQICPASCMASGTSQGLVSQTVADQYWRAEAAFTYRLLRTVSEFGIRGGVYRGSSLVSGVTDASQFNVGLNYGAPWIRLRATDWLHLEAEFLTSVTQVGFSLGGGGAVLLGDPYASHLTLGFESIDVFGSRGYSRFDAVVTPRLRVAPTVEVTSMPAASSAGVRLLMDIGIDLGRGWLLTVRGGYQARTFDAGGPAAGGGLAYAF
jgi:hypothetical protein